MTSYEELLRFLESEARTIEQFMLEKMKVHHVSNVTISLQDSEYNTYKTAYFGQNSATKPRHILEVWQK